MITNPSYDIPALRICLRYSKNVGIEIKIFLYQNKFKIDELCNIATARLRKMLNIF